MHGKEVGIDSDEFYREVENAITKRHGYKVKLLEDFAQGCEDKRLLEVGCGLGVELGRLGKLGFDVTGIDLAPKAVEMAETYLRKLGLRGKAMVQDAEQMDFPDESFDAIYSSGVLQHTSDIKRAIREMLRVLRPGGKMLVVLYHRRSWFHLLHKLTGVNIEFDDRDAPIINAYTRGEAKDLFSGLREVRISCEYYYPHVTNRPGLLAMMFNYLFVPATKLVPRNFIRRFGWHLVITGVK
jgi:ubiquinone/menaquinone biosynthesis C-methylase UbiE